MKATSSSFNSQQGSVSIAITASISIAMVLCLLVADVGLYLSARYRAQNAADAAALAAAQESFPLFSTGRGPKSAARKMAAENEASLEDIEVSAGGDHVQVEVSVRPQSLLLRRFGFGPSNASAKAAAEVDIRALLANSGIWYTADPAALARIKDYLSGKYGGEAGAAATMVALLALQQLGKPYVWGATGPSAFDCSGLVCFVFAQIGVRLPRVTFSQVNCGRAVSPGGLAPGDLVFFRHNAHVGIYLGGGWFIHAPRTGDVVKITALGSRSDLSACRRIL